MVAKQPLSKRHRDYISANSKVLFVDKRDIQSVLIADLVITGTTKVGQQCRHGRLSPPKQILERPLPGQEASSETIGSLLPVRDWSPDHRC
jgi:hypothetical protein